MGINGAPRAAGGESGFTLIEILVVVLIIGILAAIAIPTFLGQKNKANDAAAEEQARAGSLAAETYATDHQGTYTGLSEPKTLHEYDPEILANPSTSDAYVKEAKETESGAGYTVTAISPVDGDTFTVTRSKGGEVTRKCTAPGSNKGGCPNETW